MPGPGRNEVSLEDRVRASRKLSADGTKAVYDMRSAMDFSNPRRAAEAIAQVVWDEDLRSWWRLEDGEAICEPTRTVELWVPDVHSRQIAKTVKEFESDLRDRELGDAVSRHLDSDEDHEADWGAIFLLGPLWAFILQAFDNSARRKEALARLFGEMADSISITEGP